ncbi:MAG: protein-glutamate O-methyltransferase CheR [Alphaproteobacteria bacterium]|nr:protein-glutamate O-methyltransferase CheR [Alphaproteobacteria bacterium]
MRTEDVAYLAQMLRRRCGILLTQSKPKFIEGRLAPVMRRFGFKDVSALVAELRHGRDALGRAVSEALTTNESSFFRDPDVFAAFRDSVLPALLTRRQSVKRLRIWSAACAAGQEVYSIAMILDDLKLSSRGWSVDLIASDLSADMIARAEQGVYSHFEVQRGIPPDRFVAHFLEEGAHCRVSERLRRMVTFRTFNLLDSFGWLEDVDIVFCRNVLMYFEPRAKAAVLDKLAEVMLPDGYLVLGRVETTKGLSDCFRPLPDMPGFYAPIAAALPRAAAG